jgi:hypothetical protein
MDIVLSYMDDTKVVQRVLITDWLELPVESVDLDLNVDANTLARR